MTFETPLLQELARTIEPPSEQWRQKALAHLDTLTKPLGSLGRLEGLVAQVLAIRRQEIALPVKKAVFVFAADHGITAEGVSAYPREVTHQMVLNFLHHGAAVNVLAALHNVELCVADIGVDADFEDIPGLLHHKVRRGTRNMLHEAAMTPQETEEAISIGVQLASDAASAGVAMIAIGEMGIGNTTSASAITCALTNAPPEEATGHGTGISTNGHLHKVSVVCAILEKHFVGKTKCSPLNILASVGGLEIAAMVGMILGAARARLIIVIDGFISTAAAALAVSLAPSVAGYLIAGHQSQEPGHRLLLDRLQLTPVLSLNMRLGEGTGAVLAMPLIESAIALYTRMATFASAGVSGAS
ncbi:nicotinate-nucleotide--dimethylbenzimidazole phosphoribosyltransferase [Terriglobus albidus]|uniref:nicotinate-nucleotide--dimethylbenzimidazole phosphoribosyltransferase n=1 Tax=Terriglobus albidus TaxID=1592106 RepID=UPI0021DF76C6|nr:nicotinate-nucleotide--dimethylbenzimidazole phosphoribosyltransferase [Terriglobus albidus]